jgi:hypothetical protein
MPKSRKIALLRWYLFILSETEHQSVANTVAIYLLLTNLLDFIHLTEGGRRKKKVSFFYIFYGFECDKFIC